MKPASIQLCKKIKVFCPVSKKPNFKLSFYLLLWMGVKLGLSAGVLRGMFGSKTQDVTGSWRKLHNEEFHNLYLSQNVIKVTKSRGMKWGG
jgi:hypothetical protein